MKLYLHFSSLHSAMALMYSGEKDVSSSLTSLRSLAASFLKHSSRTGSEKGIEITEERSLVLGEDSNTRSLGDRRTNKSAALWRGVDAGLRSSSSGHKSLIDIGVKKLSPWRGVEVSIVIHDAYFSTQLFTQDISAMDIEMWKYCTKDWCFHSSLWSLHPNIRFFRRTR